MIFLDYDQNDKIQERYLDKKAFELLKQRAKQIKKQNNIPHHQALELAAKQVLSVQNYHQIVIAYQNYEPIYNAYANGIIFCIDISEYFEKDEHEMHFSDTQEHYVLKQLFYESIVENHILESKEYDELRGFKNYYPEEEYLMDAKSFISHLIFFRIKNRDITLDEGLQLLRDQFFFPPTYIWYKGKLVE